MPPKASAKSAYTRLKLNENKLPVELTSLAFRYISRSVCQQIVASEVLSDSEVLLFCT